LAFLPGKASQRCEIWRRASLFWVAAIWVNAREGWVTMRLRKEVLERLAATIARELMRFGYVETEMSEDELRFRLNEWISSDLRVEDSLNEEVRGILAEFEGEMDRRNVEYSRMFDLVKRRLVRERNLIL
jgi:hypothetical protein